MRNAKRGRRRVAYSMTFPIFAFGIFFAKKRSLRRLSVANICQSVKSNILVVLPIFEREHAKTYDQVKTDLSSHFDIQVTF